MKLRWLIVAAVVAYLAFALVTLPASVVLGRFQDAGLSAAGVGGTVWKGRAAVVQLQGANLGSIEWDLHALALLTLKLKADIKVTRPEGFAEGVVSARSDSILLDDFTASLPLSALSGVAPGGWTGTVNLRFDRLVLNDGWPVAAHGTAEILNVTSASQRTPLTGSFQVAFPETESETDTVVGTVSDLGGPLQIAGTLELRPERSYLLKGLVAARPDAPQSLANQLQILGPADAQGRRPFSLEGTL